MLRRCAAVAFVVLAACGPATAQSYPIRPVRLIVPFPPGSPSDFLGRIVAQRLSETLGQAVVLDNRGGAAGTIGVDLTHVAYKGGGPGVVALMAGEVQVMFTGMAVLLPFVKSGKVKGIAISSASRSSLLPAMPTLIESGLPGYTMGLSMGILAPAKTPAVVLRTLNREIVATVRVPEVRERFLDQGAEPIGSTAEAFHEHIVSELRRYKDVIQAAGIQAE